MYVQNVENRLRCFKKSPNRPLRHVQNAKKKRSDASPEAASALPFQATDSIPLCTEIKKPLKKAVTAAAAHAAKTNPVAIAAINIEIWSAAA
jgi:hypothetical protein